MSDFDVDSFLDSAEKDSGTKEPVLKKKETTKVKRPSPVKKALPEKKKDAVNTPEKLDIVLGANRKPGKVGEALTKIEKRFLEVTGLGAQVDAHGERLQVKTDKNKSDAHGEVFTPLWLAKKMVEQAASLSKKRSLWVSDENQSLTTEDLCAGYGQFTLSILRSKYEALGEEFKITKFLGQTHLFIELQPNSCYRLLSIFGSGIRLLMGDASKKALVPDEAEKGIWVWSEHKKGWLDATSKIKDLVKETNSRYHKDKWPEKAAYFEGRVDEWLGSLAEEN